jgi:hypothetical protein
MDMQPALRYVLLKLCTVRREVDGNMGMRVLLVASRGQEKCVGCVLRCLKDVYQLRPKVSEERVSVASQGV